MRWLSRGKVFHRLFELKEEEQIFLADKKHPLAQKCADNEWLAQLAYLAEIFECLNALNLGLQGQDTDLFKLTAKMEGWIKKLRMWRSRIISGDFGVFDLLGDFVEEHNVAKGDLQASISSHMEGLSEQFQNYFPEKESKDKVNNWIRNPFNTEFMDGATSLPLSEQEALIDLWCDELLRAKFTGQPPHKAPPPLATLWISVRNEYPGLCDAALKKLIPFASTYLCEAGFSALTLIKNKYRSRLAVEADLRLFLSTTQPRIMQLCSNVQAHPSH